MTTTESITTPLGKARKAFETIKAKQNASQHPDNILHWFHTNLRQAGGSEGDYRVLDPQSVTINAEVRTAIHDMYVAHARLQFGKLVESTLPARDDKGRLVPHMGRYDIATRRYMIHDFLGKAPAGYEALDPNSQQSAQDMLTEIRTAMRTGYECLAEEQDQVAQKTLPGSIKDHAMKLAAHYRTQAKADDVIRPPFAPLRTEQFLPGSDKKKDYSPA